MDDQSDFFREVMDLFMSRFLPCESIAHATHFFSTNEIHQALMELNPGSKISKEDLYIHLREYGFCFNIEDQKFSFTMKWMLTEK